jgi:hypothetical protein
MKKSLLLMLLLMAPVVMGEISIETVYEDAFLGDSLGLKVILTPEVTENAIFSAILECSSNSLQYYTKPVSLSAAKSLTIRVPALDAYLTGECQMIARLSRLTGEEIEDKYSNSFSVGSVLDLEASLDKEVLSPGDVVTLSGKVTRGSEVVRDVALTITFQGTPQNIELSSGSFSEKITIGESAQSGRHDVVVTVSDEFGNIQETRLNLVVEAIPSEVTHTATSLSVAPGDTLGVLVLLLDQAGIVLQQDVTLRLVEERSLRSDVIVFSTVLASDGTFDFTFDNSIAPGEYVLESSFGGLTDRDAFVVEEVSALESTFEGKILTLVNTGNVPYANDASITLVSEDDVFVIKEKLRLDVNEQKIIDLSENAPSGSYEAVITDEPISKEEAEELLQERQAGNSITGMSIARGDSQQELVASAVDIDYGRRGVLQKIGDGTSAFFAPNGFSIMPYVYVIVGIGVIFLLRRFLKSPSGGRASKDISSHQIEKHIEKHGVEKE